MRKVLLMAAGLCLAGFSGLQAQQLVHYWNFSSITSEASHLAPSYTAGGATLQYIAGGSSANDYLNGDGQNFNVQNLNARNGDASGNHLRINNPIGATIVFSLPTSGYSDVLCKFATRRSAQGAGTQVVEYSVDGTNYLPFTTINPNNGDPTLQTLDFSAIAAADNNPLFKIRVSFQQGSGNTSGNNRFDNVTLDGTPAGTDVLPPSITVMPANGAVDQSPTIHPTITFNEAVRQLNNAALDNNSVDALVVLRSNNATGTDVLFDATISGNTITITPASTLANGQTYYVALKANEVEDLSDNAVTSVQASNFTTIATQTVFNPGDLLFVAYQMNAVPNEDRIAFVTFVDILPGTKINFTDAKYTTNTPAQCAGGFTWTAPDTGVHAGKVITINNDAGTADAGTVTGSGFGLSQNGDQVIVYTGTNTDPHYITALSSLAWSAGNISCSGSNSMLPASLIDGVSAINLSAAPGNTSGNTVNGYYAGSMTGTVAQLKALIANPANWLGSASGTPAQTWPAWSFLGTGNPGNPNNTIITFASPVVSIAENAGQATITLTLTAPADASVDLVIKPAPFSTANATDYTAPAQTLHFTASSTGTQTINIPISDDGLNEQDEYFMVALENPVGLTIGSQKFTTVYIRDNERQAPVPNKAIALNYVASYDPSGNSNASTEIVQYDSATRRLFVISALQNRLDIADFSNPASIQPIGSVDMTPYGGITSVAVKDGVVAVAAPNANQQLNGSVVFFDINGNFQKQVTVGALPDMITFTPDGKKVMTANEGQPNDSYTTDPEGTVSIIDISNGIGAVSQSSVTTLDFTAFNANAAQLIAAGVRKGFPGSTLSQDLEPEYITITPDSKKAWVILQEANAFAVIDLTTNSITGLWPLGKKDHSLFGNGFDASDRGEFAHIANWPVKGIYMPDGIANYTVNGKTYIVGANEGDDREYSAFNERVRVNAAAYVLDSAKFPNAAFLKDDNNLGRLRVTTASGDTDGDGDFDEIHLIGGRSFSIWDTESKQVVFDSGDDFEQFLSKTPAYAPVFNADNESNTRKSRSTSKGPEPEGLALASIRGKTYAFTGLERQGGVMVYDITDPANVAFVDYNNARNLSSFGGDNGPEGIIYISDKQSPDSNHYVIVANEISGTLSIYRLSGNVSNQAPVITITSPANNTTVAAGSKQLLRAEASDSDGAVVKVDFFHEGVLFATDSVAPYELTSEPLEAGNYKVTAMATDSEGATKVSDTLTVTATACTPAGYIVGEGYLDIPGQYIGNLTGSPKYPAQPDVIARLNAFEYGQNIGDNYGARVRGYICAPASGLYTFFISSDDQSEVWLSTDDNAGNKRKIAFLNSPVSFRAYRTFYTQQSAQVYLVKGARYYIETLHKESTGNDHLSLAWVLPGGVTEAPIPGNRLSPVEEPTVIAGREIGKNFEEDMNESLLNTATAFSVKVTANPVSSYFTLVTRSNQRETLTVTVTDMLGRIVERRVGIAPNGTVYIGQQLTAGVYVAEVKQGAQKHTLKLVKQ